jgi:hypothetical protein
VVIRGGRGFIGGSLYFGSAMTLVNQGTIAADVGSTTLTIQGPNTWSNSGMVHVGSTSKITSTSNYTQLAGGTLAIDLGGTATSQYGQLLCPGSTTVTLAGLLKVNLVGGFMLSPGDTFDIMTFASRAGDFTEFMLPPLMTAVPGATKYQVTR